ncbi:hypothetical protein ABPG74_000349 [Tetrahymena malaccensis]
MHQGKSDNLQGRPKQPGVQLPPIDRKGNKSNVRQNAQMQNQQKETKQTEDKYEQMRNRSKNNADRLQKLKDIKSQYTIKKGKKGEKLQRIKSENDQGAYQGNDGFEVYDVERVNSNNADEENIASLINNYNKNHGKDEPPIESEIEALERELAQLKNDIKSQELSIAELDDIQKKTENLGQQQQQQKQQQFQPQQPDLKNMVFGQRVKGKDMNDYWNQNEQKTTFKVQQNPGGQSQINIGGDYNFFKDKENADYKSNKNGKNFYSPNGNKVGQRVQQEEVIYNTNNNQLRTNSDNNSQISSQKKHHPNEQSYNIINHSNFDDNSSKYNGNNLQQSGYQNQNKQSINIFEGYPAQNQNGNNKQKNSNPFINSLYYQQEKEQQQNYQHGASNARGQQLQQQPQQQAYNQYNQQSSDITADGKKNVRVSQPPGGKSQIVFC